MEKLDIKEFLRNGTSLEVINLKKIGYTLAIAGRKAAFLIFYFYLHDANKSCLDSQVFIKYFLPLIAELQCNLSSFLLSLS
jgi:hypothetical protein